MQRGSYLFLAMPALLVGCDPGDPVWDMPCSERPAQAVEIGTGGEEFVAADAAPIPIQYGSQGGQHIWVSLRLRGFGPTVAASFGIRDALDPSRIYSGPNAEHPELRYDVKVERSEAIGMYGYLTTSYDPDTMMEMPGPSGKSVTFWADVTDDCSAGKPVHAEATGTVQ
ncbi:MAG: hypothetical protein U0441_27265 [Polyangiaceae bacterium]